MKSLNTALFVTAFVCGGLFSQAAYSAPTCSADTDKTSNTGITFNGRPISSGFGSRNLSNPNASRFHRGIDLAVTGRQNSMHGGVVSTGYGKGYGNFAYITNGNFRVMYAHAGNLGVTNGQTIAPGQYLGNWSGCTGTCTGDHIHLEYQVIGSNGEWAKVDPISAQKLIDAGMDPNSPEFAQAALEATMNGCNVDEDALQGAAGAGGYLNEIDEMCDPNIRAQLVTQSQAVLTFRQEAMQQIIVPPPAPSMIANTPCFSKELQRATDTFSSMPQQFMSGITSQLGGLANIAGPASGIMNQFFEAGVTSMNQAAGNLPGMLNFQQLASDALGNLLGSLGAGSGFSGELCGMMVDMVVNFLQCQFPMELPQMPSLDLNFPSLNDLLPQGCAGDAARKLIYEGAATLPSVTQPATLGNRSTSGQQ